MSEIGTASLDFQRALALHRQGRMDDAARDYELILHADPSHLEALIHLGSLRLGQGQAYEAEALLRQAATLAPESPEALGNLAASLQALGRHEEAATYYARALTFNPDMPDARFGLAACLQATGRNEAAVVYYKSILAAEPGHPEANYGLATLLVPLGHLEDAAAAYRAAIAADPDFAEANYGLGKLLARGDAKQEAVGHFLSALDVDPDYIEARLALATTLLRLERDDEAMAAFRTVLTAEPENPEAHNGIGTLLDRKRRHAEAIEHYRLALSEKPDHFDAMGGMANALKNLGQHTQALGIARKMVALRPDHALAASLLGSILAEMGAIQEGQAEFERALRLDPRKPEFSYYLAQVTKVKPGDAILSALETTLPRAAALPPHEQCQLHFALGKAYDDIGERAKGFTHLLQGNAIKRSSIRYEEAIALGAMDRIASVFTADLLAARAGLGDPSTVPVFIVGMPRSGTTLVEQILASHSAVFGAGERQEIPNAVARLDVERIGAARFPEVVWTMTGDDFRRIGAEYLDLLRPLAPEAARIVDKMPGNFLFVGLIHLILPNARIIHTVRDPVDTCLSCFSKLFAGEQAFSYDLAELGRYHRAYRGLMAHWRAALPAGVMLEVEYEALVEDFEPHARRIVAHCGLEWEPACLEFYKTSRAVHTASLTQVRQPIYRSSIGRWRPDAALLRPLLRGLAVA